MEVSNFAKIIGGGHQDVRVFAIEHGGITKARNYGLKQATGEWLLFVDQDDVAIAETVEKAVFWGECEKLDVVLWSTERMYEDGTTKPCDVVWRDQILSGSSVQNELVCDMLMNVNNHYVSYLGHIWGGIYNKILIDDDIQFRRFVDAEDDYLFVMDMLCRANRVGLTKENGYNWRYNKKSETYRQKYIADITEKYEQLYRHIDRKIEKYEISESVRTKYQHYRIQNILLRAIENSFQCLHFSKKEHREIRKMYCDNQKAFKVTSVAELSGRQKRIYWLLQHNMFDVASIYVYVDSVYRMCRCRVKKARECNTL